MDFRKKLGEKKLTRVDGLTIIAGGLCVVIGGVFLAILRFKYTHFRYDDWDLAYFSQTLWNLAHGRQYSSLFSQNFFGNHANFIAYLLVPIYKIYPHPFVLIVTKVLFFMVSAYLFYFIARPRVGIAALFLMLLYIFYPPNLFGLIYEFDYENLAPPILFALLYFFEKEKWPGFLISSCALMLIKENLPLIVVAFGVLGLFTKKNKLAWGVIPVGLGSLAFFLLTSVVVPFFNSGQIFREHPYIHLYKGLGRNFVEVVETVVSRPDMAYSLLTDPHRIEWLLSIFQPLCFLPFFSLPAMVLIFPILAQHFFSANYSEQSVHFYYIMICAPFLFWGTMRVLSLYRTNSRRFYLGFLAALGIFAVLNFGNEWEAMKEGIYRPDYAAKSYMVEFKSKILKEVTPQNSVVATFTFLPELSLRHRLYAFYKIYSPKYRWQAKTNAKIAEKAQYAYIDFFDLWLLKTFNNNFEYSQNQIYDFFQKDWSVKDALENVVLFEKKKNPLRLVEVSREPFPGVVPNLNVRIDRKLTLVSVARGVALNDNPAALPLIFYWKAEGQIDTHYAIMSHIKQGQNEVMNSFREIGYAIYPTKTWREGDYIKEYCWLYVPKMDLGRAILAFDFWTKPNFRPEKQRAFIESDGPGAINNERQVEVRFDDL